MVADAGCRVGAARCKSRSRNGGQWQCDGMEWERRKEKLLARTRSAAATSVPAARAAHAAATAVASSSSVPRGACPAGWEAAADAIAGMASASRGAVWRPWPAAVEKGQLTAEAASRRGGENALPISGAVEAYGGKRGATTAGRHVAHGGGFVETTMTHPESSTGFSSVPRSCPLFHWLTSNLAELNQDRPRSALATSPTAAFRAAAPPLFVVKMRDFADDSDARVESISKSIREIPDFPKARRVWGRRCAALAPAVPASPSPHPSPSKPFPAARHPVLRHHHDPTRSPLLPTLRRSYGRAIQRNGRRHSRCRPRGPWLYLWPTGGPRPRRPFRPLSQAQEASRTHRGGRLRLGVRHGPHRGTRRRA